MTSPPTTAGAVDTATAALTMTAITKRFGSVQALAGADLRLAAGEICGLLGPNGSGKTTLVRIASGLLAADGGTVTVQGRDPRAAGHLRSIGIAPQELGLYPALTVDENLRFFGEINGLSRSEARQRAATLAGELALDALGGRASGQLSGGEQRRLHVAAALVHRPALILLDEPTAGVDMETRAIVLNLVRRVAAEGAAVVYTTHYLPEIEQLDPTVSIVAHGRIVARGTRAELVARLAQSGLVLEFSGPPPVLPGVFGAVINGTSLRVPGDDPPRLLAEVLPALGADVARLRDVHMVDASLETVYLGATAAEPTGFCGAPDSHSESGAPQNGIGKGSGEQERAE